MKNCRKRAGDNLYIRKWMILSSITIDHRQIKMDSTSIETNKRYFMCFNPRESLASDEFPDPIARE